MAAIWTQKSSPAVLETEHGYLRNSVRRLSATLQSFPMHHPHFGIKFTHDEWAARVASVEIAFRGALRQHVKDDIDKKYPDSPVAKVLIGILIYLALLFALEREAMFPWGAGFALILTWTSSKVGGEVMKKIGMPGLMGNLLAGILLKNAIPNGDVTFKTVRGLPDYWASDLITCGLTIIFLRGGLEIDLELVKKAGLVAVRLTVLPGVSEALTVACVAMALFGMSFILGLSLGFILAAVSPAVVVGAMFELKKKGYGVKQNIPVLVVAAASFDDVVAISGFAICISFAIPSSHSSSATTILHATHGPVTLLLGMLCGLLGGGIAAMTKVWDRPWKRTAIVACQGFIFSFGAKRLEQNWEIEHAHPVSASAGILAALCMAGITSFCWERGYGCYTLGKDAHFAHAAEAQLAYLWDEIAQPLLFGIVGSYLDFRVMDGVVVAKAIAIVCSGLCVRTLVAFLATHGTPLTMRERLFVALAWMPKATVQAAFAGVPLTLILKKHDWDSHQQELDFQRWGNDILTTAVLAILMTAPVVLLIIQKLGPRWLQKDSTNAETRVIDEIIEAYSARSNFDIADELSKRSLRESSSSKRRSETRSSETSAPHSPSKVASTSAAALPRVAEMQSATSDAHLAPAQLGVDVLKNV